MSERDTKIEVIEENIQENKDLQSVVKIIPFYKTKAFYGIVFLILSLIVLFIYYGWFDTVDTDGQYKLVKLKYPGCEILNYDIIDKYQSMFCILHDGKYKNQLIKFRSRNFKSAIIDDTESTEFLTKRNIAIIKYRGWIGDGGENLIIMKYNPKTKDYIKDIEHKKINKDQNSIKIEVPDGYSIILQTIEGMNKDGKINTDNTVKIDSIELLSFNKGLFNNSAKLNDLVRIISYKDLTEVFTSAEDASRKKAVSLGKLAWPGYYLVK